MKSIFLLARRSSSGVQLISKTVSLFSADESSSITGLSPSIPLMVERICHSKIPAVFQSGSFSSHVRFVPLLEVKVVLVLRNVEYTPN